MIYDVICQMSKMLSNLSDFLTEAEQFADAKGFPIDNLLTARLAPDMFPLVNQVQFACDAGKFAAARLSGKTPPKEADEEQTIEDLHARIKRTVDYLATFSAEDFEGGADRSIELSIFPAPMAGTAYLVGFAQPQLYFHTTTAYNILRHNGVELGKRLYIGGAAAKN